jgi:hypothetical protein
MLLASTGLGYKANVSIRQTISPEVCAIMVFMSDSHAMRDVSRDHLTILGFVQFSYLQ